MKGQIGVIEYRSSIQDPAKRLKQIRDSEGDIDLDKLNSPLFYRFVKPSFLDRSNAEIKVGSEKDDQVDDLNDNKPVGPPDVVADADGSDMDDDAADSVFAIPKTIKKTETKKDIEQVLKQGIFTIETDFQPPKTLPEETKADADELTQQFRESPNNTWIESYMKNNEFAIVPTITNGDCLFDTIVKAFEQIGRKTTPAKLRASLAEELTEDIYKLYRDLYLNAIREKDDILKKQKLLKKEYKDCKQKVKSLTLPKNEERKLMEDCKKLKGQYDRLTQDKENNDTFLDEEYAFMKGVDSIDKLRQVIQTTQFWANDWAISILERVLNVKLIIMSKTAFESGDLPAVLQCNDNDARLSQQGFFRPDFYIITAYSGNHYELISYKQKFIFTFSELPFYLKTLIMNRCLERNKGAFHLIDEVRNFHLKMGVDLSEIGPKSEDGDGDDGAGSGSPQNHLYDSSTIFKFYAKSDPKNKPGKGNNETIDARNIADYKDLQKIKDWRRMLDDQWPAPFKMDGHEWETVEHYYQAAKFKNKNHDFYLLFTNTSDSPFAKDADLAKIAGSEKGKYTNKITKKVIVFRDPKKITIDPDFFGTRHLEERQRALYAKFSQSPDLKHVLLATNRAKLMRYVPNAEAVVDKELMTVRNELAREEGNVDKK